MGIKTRFQYYDKKMVQEIKKWCKSRNRLVYGLVRLDLYGKYDQMFKGLAIAGEPLVERIYNENTKFRD